MASDPSVSATYSAPPSNPPLRQGSAVLARVESRVRRRLEMEQASAVRTGDGGHAASLIRPWPL